MVRFPLKYAQIERMALYGCFSCHICNVLVNVPVIVLIIVNFSLNQMKNSVSVHAGEDRTRDYVTPGTKYKLKS